MRKTITEVHLSTGTVLKVASQACTHSDSRVDFFGVDREMTLKRTCDLAAVYSYRESWAGFIIRALTGVIL